MKIFKLPSIKKLSNNEMNILKICISIFLTIFIVELLNENIVFLVLPNRLLLNIIIVGFLYLFFICLFNNVKLSIIISNIILFCLAFANYSVNNLRGTPLSLLDILSVRTGLTIVNTYTIVIKPYLILAILSFAFLIYYNSKINYKLPTGKRTVFLRAITIICVVLIMFLLLTTQLIKIFFLATDLWDPRNEYHSNGFLASFIKQINDLVIKKPDGYSVNTIKEIYYDTLATTAVTTNLDENPVIIEEKTLPNIIVVMNESFADMRVHYDFKTNKEFMSYFKSVYNNTIHGTIHSSVYGGQTPNSEWEFLTNNSMAFLSYGSIPYQQYIKDNMYSLVSILESQGYSSSAIHTWYKAGYRRISVYPLFGFDSFVAYEDVQDEVELIRNYPSDLSTYKLLTKQFEERDKDKPFFNFTITMQNHSGYDYKGDDFTSNITLTDIPNCPRVEQYLSLIAESDEALKYLIDYFNNVDEKTIILFFGDHQPPYIEDEFWDYINQNKTDSLTDAEKGYLTPYFIWANYELQEYNVPDISINYLSTLLLDVAGLKTTPYQDYLRKMSLEIPVITGHGYMDKTGTYHDFTENNEFTPWIKKYAILEYNNMLGRKSINQEMFQIQRTGE